MSRKTILIFLGIVLSISAIAQDTYIQVVAEPGISVFINQNLMGVTNSDYGGLIIENVSPGKQTIKMIKEGFNPQEEQIDVKQGEVFTYMVRPFIPKLKISESGNTGQQEIEMKVGNLLVQSLPISISIKIPSLAIDYTKKKDEWKVEEIPEGKYLASFFLKDNILSDSIEINASQTTHLFVNMIKMEVENRSPFNITHNSMTDGTESMKNEQSSSVQRKLFPVYGVTLGKTRVSEIEELGYECENWKGGCKKVCEVNRLKFWDHDCDGIVEFVGVEYRDFPTEWQSSLGVNAALSFNEWIEVLERLGFTIDITKPPHEKVWKGRKTLKAKVVAKHTNDRLEINLNFGFGKGGYSVDSPNTLFNLIIRSI
ncbi:MAG: hypothetical protein ISR95_01065 [Candidatus Marinimicrobia bacterium]|nr:hypothetical protein [Candidatus Brocadiales bacterium]MBL7046220.1 hypothetical protein [Candidatus Neomarinimicrobiota bacterium]